MHTFLFNTNRKFIDMELYINPFRHIAVWPSPFYDGFHEIIKLNKDLSYKKTLFDDEATPLQVLLYGVANGIVPAKGWVRINVKREEFYKWDDVWPKAVRSKPINIEELL